MPVAVILEGRFKIPVVIPVSVRVYLVKVLGEPGQRFLNESYGCSGGLVTLVQHPPHHVGGGGDSSVFRCTAVYVLISSNEEISTRRCDGPSGVGPLGLDLLRVLKLVSEPIEGADRGHDSLRRSAEEFGDACGAHPNPSAGLFVVEQDRGIASALLVAVLAVASIFDRPRAVLFRDRLDRRPGEEITVALRDSGLEDGDKPPSFVADLREGDGNVSHLGGDVLVSLIAEGVQEHYGRQLEAGQLFIDPLNDLHDPGD